MAEFRVERSIAIQAPAEQVYPLISDLRAWQRWSPWEEVDPQLQRTYAGAPSGKGAKYAWSGNRNVGSGEMEIREATPSSEIVIDLHFIKPFEARNVAEFTLAAEGGATRVTWAMRGPKTFLSRVMGLFVNMDRMVGGMFEKGLAQLKTVAEK